MPGDCRCDLTNACVAIYRIHCTRGYRAHRAPGIPAPSEQEGGTNRPNSGISGREIANSCLQVFRNFFVVPANAGTHTPRLLGLALV
jgi:hypothetical protein